MNKLQWNKKYTWLKTGAYLILSLSLIFSVVGAGIAENVLADENGISPNPYVVRTFIDEQGREIVEEIFPPCLPEVKVAVANVPEPDPLMGTNTLPNVPAFDWSYGCSATAAAMMYGYYDRIGYPNMYTGPTNGGVCPLTNTAWGSGECSLSATHQGYDGLAVPGHVDDYWTSEGSGGPDPYFGNWPQHTHGDCTSDYMGTNQWNNLSPGYQNVDGSTRFWYYSDGSPLVNYTWPESVGGRDGCYGMRLFAESRGYSVNTNYFQKIYGAPGTTGGQGFTYDNYKQQIDAGRPVLIQVTQHTMLGVGYNDAGNLVYLHDTWDHAVHQMPWGGTYGGWRQHTGVTVLELDPLGSVPDAPGAFSATPDTTQVDVSWTPGAGSEKTMVRWSNVAPPTTPASGTQGYFGPGTSWQHTGLPPGTPLYYSAWGWRDGSDIWSTTYASAIATTASDPPDVSVTPTSFEKTMP